MRMQGKKSNEKLPSWTIECNNQTEKNGWHGWTNEQQICACLPLLYGGNFCAWSVLSVGMHLQRCTAHILRLIPPPLGHYPLEVVAFPFPLSYILTESVFTLKLPCSHSCTLSTFGLCCARSYTHIIVSFHYFTFRSVAHIHSQKVVCLIFV